MTRMSLRRKTVVLPPDPRISLLEEEIRKARQYREYDVPYRSLDERLDTMESRVDVAGDMKKSQYDKNNNGKVDYAEMADWTYGIDWSNVQNKPSIPAPYSLPVATESQLGGVKSGGDIRVLHDGTMKFVGTVSGGSNAHQSAINGFITIDDVDVLVYSHPVNTSTRHVSDLQIQQWTSKAENVLATPTSDGIMSKFDKAKLDKLNPVDNPLSQQDADKLYASITHGHGVASTVLSGFMSYLDKQKLDGISTGAINQSQADGRYAAITHSHSVATQTSAGFMSAVDKVTLDNLSSLSGITQDQADARYAAIGHSHSNATSSASGFMSYQDKARLDSIYSSYLSQGTADTLYAPKVHTHSTATTTTSGFMSSSDKTKLDDLAQGITQSAADARYLAITGGTVTGPVTFAANNNPEMLDFKSGTSMTSVYMGFYNDYQRQTLRTGYIGFPSAMNLTIKNERDGGNVELSTKGTGVPTANGNEILHKGNIDANIATQSSSGFLSAADKIILDNLSTNSGITQSQADARYSQLDHTHSVATRSSAGFMSAEDKTKLDNYVQGITQGAADARYSLTSHVHNVATQSTAGFMSGADKTKLDGLVQGLSQAAGDARYSLLTHRHAVATINTDGFMSYQDKVKLDSLSNIDMSKYTLQTDFTQLSDKVNTIANGGGGVPRMDEVTATFNLAAGASQLQQLPVRFPKYDVRTVYAKATNGNNFNVQVKENTGSNSFTVYQSLDQPEIYDIAMVPCQDKSGSSCVNVLVTNKDKKTDSFTVIIKVTELL